MADPLIPADPATTIILAARALGKVDTYGLPRGVTMITTHEIEAMALLLASFGLVPIQPGAPVPTDAKALFTPVQRTL